jgi:DNA-binding response OmpR family regulator/REP element-mobilizing transposase RayT
MAVRVLIVSPDTGFGGLIQQTLEKSERYEPVMVSTGRQALEIARQIPLDLAILDADTGDLTISELGPALRAVNSEIRILLIPSDEPESVHQSGGMEVNGYLTKPFYLPDLVDIVDSALADIEGAGPEQDKQAGIENSDELFRTGAEYPTPSQSYQNSAFDDATWPGNNALAAQHLARLSMSTSSQAALVLRHDQMWAYAGQLSQESAQELAKLVQLGSGSELIGDRGSTERDVDLARFVHLKTTGKEHLLYATSLEDNMLLVLAFDARTPFSEIHNQANSLAAALAALPGDELLDRQQTLQSFFAEPQMGGVTAQYTVETEVEQSDGTDWALEFDVWRHGESGEGEGEYDQDSTQPVHVNQPLEAYTPSGPTMVFDLHYACILVPRLPDHYLIGDLSTSISTWMRRLSLAFGWRLEYLALRPRWMQWIAGVEPDTSAEHVVQQIRRSTSDLIFAEFPRFAAENPSADFWAPGYLVMTSTKPLPGEIVKEFTERTRLRQGISGEN